MSYSEIRDSIKSELFDKVRKQSYGKYLYKLSMKNIRAFEDESISFDFPVTALIGPNGGGKSSVLGSAGCSYKSIKPGQFFPKSSIGDDSMAGWKIEYEITDKTINSRQLIKRSSSFKKSKWVRDNLLERDVVYFGIERTVPAGEKTKYNKLKSRAYHFDRALSILSQNTSEEIERILGKDVNDFQYAEIDESSDFFIGYNNGVKYSEFHFGAGESSIIRMVEKIEAAQNDSLVIIEEIENGLHPIATKRMVEYLIDVAKRKNIQSIFTTHSDYALEVLPDEAIWACLNGKLRQGKLSIESLRAISGRVDKKLAIFVEDDFAKNWVDSILREKMGEDADQVETYSVAGDGNAVSIHKSHNSNPAINFKSLCIIDGDSRQEENIDNGIIRLPGKQPELTVYNDILLRLDELQAVLTVSCQRSPERQAFVSEKVREVSHINRDPHLLFNRLGIEIGYVAEVIVRGAFLSLWIRSNDEYCIYLTQIIRNKLST
jgi:AAA15 family ATPase/GTPase